MIAIQAGLLVGKVSRGTQTRAALDGGALLDEPLAQDRCSPVSATSLADPEPPPRRWRRSKPAQTLRLFLGQAHRADGTVIRPDRGPECDDRGCERCPRARRSRCRGDSGSRAGLVAADRSGGLDPEEHPDLRELLGCQLVREPSPAGDAVPVWVGLVKAAGWTVHSAPCTGTHRDVLAGTELAQMILA
jgi:hypothetical protein